MTRSWQDVKADKARRDAAHGVTWALGGRLKLVADFEDHDVPVSTSEVDRNEALT